MHRIIFLLATVFSLSASSQQARNIIVITTDGLRWQEVFGGMDSALANNTRFHQGDSEYIYHTYWHADPKERRKKLMPFLWSVMEKQGQVFGNRALGSRVNNANPYWFSYPGYSEIFTGFVDTAINSNAYPPNPNTNVLEFINHQTGFAGKVAAFGAWNAFDRILNEQRSGFPVICAFDTAGGKRPTEKERMLNSLLRDSNKPWLEDECLDLFTHYFAGEQLATKKPRVLYIAYGETDEWAHAGMYRSYLDAAHQVDAWVEWLWQQVQSDPYYRNRTALFITVDHGRGDQVKEEWTSHGSRFAGSNEIWMAAMGPGIKAKGEMKDHALVYQQQFAQTIARILGLTFNAEHPVAKPVESLFQ